MADFIRSWNSKTGHITDHHNNDGGQSIKTRCGRTLKTFQYGYPGETDCSRCGSPKDFEKVSWQKQEEYLTKQQQRQEQDSEIRARHETRLAQHRATMTSLQCLLEQYGANIIDVKERSAGREVEFEIDSLKFKLSGNIW